MPRRVKFTPSFRKDFEELDKKTKERVLHKIEWLAKNFRKPPLVKYLPEELNGLRKYRIGDWRVLLWCDDKNKQIVLYGIGHRKEIYKRF